MEADDQGTFTVLTGTSPHGQGHETAWAQIVADTLGVPFDAVTVRHSDTLFVPRGGGTMGSRSLQVGGSAVFQASVALLDKARRLAAHLLAVSEGDVRRFDGRIGVRGAPGRSLSWGELAAAAADPSSLPPGMETGLRAQTDFEMEDSTYPFGVHVAVVEVDTETGKAKLVRHVAVDDCGRRINPMLVEGQIHGGIAQGVAQALFESFVYDEAGNPQTSSLATYAMPSAAELPAFVTVPLATPTDRNPLRAKGVGEGGTIGAGPAVQNAATCAPGQAECLVQRFGVCVGVVRDETPARPVALIGRAKLCQNLRVSRFGDANVPLETVDHGCLGEVGAAYVCGAKSCRASKQPSLGV